VPAWPNARKEAEDTDRFEDDDTNIGAARSGGHESETENEQDDTPPSARDLE
jgi:hypothetical protein